MKGHGGEFVRDEYTRAQILYITKMLPGIVFPCLLLRRKISAVLRFVTRAANATGDSTREFKPDRLRFKNEIQLKTAARKLLPNY